jgi:hypothetical protein
LSAFSAGLVLVSGAGAYAFAALAGRSDCSADEAVLLGVAVAPEIEPALAKAADRFNAEGGEVGGKCVQARVYAADPAATMTLLGQGAAVGLSRRPDVWIPDSSLWRFLAQSSQFSPEGGNLVRDTRTSLAQSPIVAAMPRSLADSLRDQGVVTNLTWGDFLRSEGSTAAGDPGPAALVHMLAMVVSVCWSTGQVMRPCMNSSRISAASVCGRTSIDRAALAVAYRVGVDGEVDLADSRVSSVYLAVETVFDRCGEVVGCLGGQHRGVSFGVDQGDSAAQGDQPREFVGCRPCPYRAASAPGPP